MTSWRQERRPVERIERMALEDVPEDGLQILDVRERSEWEEGHIPGSAFAPWHDIDGVPDGLDPGQPIAVMCSSGQRSVVAASLLQRSGAKRVIHVVDGGVPTWGRLGRPLVT
jgi:rhodanese-related sulfurtransferase